MILDFGFLAFILSIINFELLNLKFMKELYTLKIFIFLVLNIFLLSSASIASWQKSDQHLNSKQTQLTQKAQTPNSDSLPKGVTQDWLNDLKDENGNRIISDDPEGDAMQQNTFTGNAAGVEFGRSVANAGDVNGDGFDDVIIGASKNNGGGVNAGRAYIFFGGATINTSVDVILTGAAVNNYFGISVSSAGDMNNDGFDDVIVGAHGYNSFTGRAYIYYGGGVMNSVADVTLTGQFTNNEFGKSVSGAGDLNGDGFDDVIVGAYASNAYTGKAYIFYGSAAMDNIADLTMNGESGSDEFGASVSNAGDVNGDGYADVTIGADNFNSGQGKAYIYFGGVSMNNVADVTMGGEGIVNYFGASVSNAGDVNDDGYSDVIVGAYGYNSNTGRTYIYYGGVSMNSIADVIMTGEEANNLFGFSVSESGDINGDGFADVIVGGYGYSSSKGRAYVYYGGTVMNNVVDLFMTGDSALNYFGYSVSGGGDVNGDGYADMITGAYGNNSSKGKAYVYTNTMTGEDIPDITMTGEGSGDFYGNVNSAGDVNGDGYDDVIVGAYYYNGVGVSSGRAYIYFGGLIMNNIADVILSGQSANARFGISVSSAGDVNNDGYSDIIVGAAGNLSSTGKAYIFFGGAAMDNIPDVVLTGETVDSYFGFPSKLAGDVNGDGYDDVIVGAYLYDNAKGREYLYYGGANMNSVPDAVMTGEFAGDKFGLSISSAGDANGDGFDDIIIGAEEYNSLTGRAYLYYGGINIDNTADIIFTGESDQRLGVSLSVAGDVNADGYSDVIISSSYVGPAEPYLDKAYIYYGGANMDNIADVICEGEPDDLFGWNVSTAGDVNGDGYSDVMIAAIFYNNGSGRSYLYFGGSDMNNVADIIMNYENAGDEFGRGKGAGDVNGDGYSDIIIGSYNYLNTGKAYIYLSSPPDNRKNLFLFGAIQGLYDPVTDIEITDTIKVYLRNTTSPYARVDSSKNILLGPGTGQNFLFRNARNNTPYYIEVTHRNALTTWSANPITFLNSDASIAFSVNSAYAYGNNEIQVDTSPYDVFAFYSGDVNQDGFIDLTDVLIIYNGTNNFLTGYVVTDLNGDSIVDLSDLLFAYNNSVNFVNSAIPLSDF